MGRKQGGETVAAGFYWNMNDWRMAVISGEGGVLEGGADERYLRVPTLLMLAAAPIMGLAFVVFLPLMGFYLVLQHFGGRVVDSARDGALALGHAVVPQWQAGTAHFRGGAAKDEKAKDAEADKSKDEPKSN